MSTIPYAIVQLHHDKKKKVAVRTDWILDFGKFKEQLKTTQKYADPIYFFYHQNQSVDPTFSMSTYSKNFDPAVAACYKGFIANKIYDSHADASNAILTKRIPFAAKKKSSVASEAELEGKVSLKRKRKAKKELAVVQQSAKMSNGSYVINAVKKLAEATIVAPLSKTICPDETNITIEKLATSSNKAESIVAPLSIKTNDTEKREVTADHSNSLCPDQTNDTIEKLATSSNKEESIVAPLSIKRNDTEKREVTADHSNSLCPDQTNDTIEKLATSSNKEESIVAPLSIKRNDTEKREVTADHSNLLCPDQTNDTIEKLATSSNKEESIVAPLSIKRNDTEKREVTADHSNLLCPDQTNDTIEKLAPSSNKEESIVAPLLVVTASKRNENETPTNSIKTKSRAHNAKSIDKYVDSDNLSEDSDCVDENDELTSVKKRLKKKTIAMKILKTKNEKLDNNCNVLRELNIQWQRKLFACKCTVEMKQIDSPKASTDAYTFTAEQQLALTLHTLPSDKNKYVVDMAKILFTIDDLNTKTGTQLDKAKIVFMSKYLLRNGGVHMTEPEIKEVLNKRRLNNKRPRSENKSKPKSKKRLHNDSDDGDDDNPQFDPQLKRSKQNDDTDDIDLNGFLLINMDTQENAPSDLPET